MEWEQETKNKKRIKKAPSQEPKVSHCTLEGNKERFSGHALFI